MSKHKRERKRINEIIERKIKQFPVICPTYVRKIWLDGYSEGRQNKTNKPQKDNLLMFCEESTFSTEPFKLVSREIECVGNIKYTKEVFEK